MHVNSMAGDGKDCEDSLLGAVQKLKQSLNGCSCSEASNKLIAEIEGLIRRANVDKDERSLGVSTMNGRTKKRVRSRDVSAIYTDGRFSMFYCIDGSKYIASNCPLSKVGETWPKTFVMGSRKCMLNPNFIESITKTPEGQHYVAVAGHKDKFSVSRRRSGEIKKILGFC